MLAWRKVGFEIDCLGFGVQGLGERVQAGVLEIRRPFYGRSFCS